jgi:HK97 family phage major capsid protein
VNDYIETLIEARNRAWHQAKEITSRATAEKRELEADERETLDRIFADIDIKKAEIDSLTARVQSEREADVAREAFADLVRPEPAASPVSNVEAFLRGQSGSRYIDVDLRKVAAEKRAIRAGATGREVRDLVVGTAGAGGNTTPTSFERQLYDFLEVYSGMRNTNATIITTTGGENLEFPRVSAHGTAAVVGEGTALAEADPAFAKMTLGAFKYGQLIQISNELLQDSGVDIVGFVAQDLGRSLGRVTDTAYVVGAGGANSPQGVMSAIGTGKTGGTAQAGVPSIADLNDLVYSVNSEYRARGAQFFMRDETAGKIRNLVNTSGDFLWQPSVQAGQPDRLLGFEVITDPNVVATGTNQNSVAFGDFSGFYIRDVGGVRLESSSDFAFSQDLVTWRAVLRTDSDLIDANAIKLYRGGTA